MSGPIPFPFSPRRPAALPRYIVRWNAFFACRAYYEWSPVTGDYAFRCVQPKGYES